MSEPLYDRPRVLGLTFTQWQAEVDRAVYRIAGVSMHDLSDTNYWDSWSAGVSPADMARDALENDDLFGSIAGELFGAE